jgi:hypothetical protein
VGVASTERLGAPGSCWGESVEDAAMAHRTLARLFPNDDQDPRGHDGLGIGLGVLLAAPLWLGLGIVLIILL